MAKTEKNMPQDKPHHNTNNRHASKGVVNKSGSINIRIEPELLGIFKNAAKVEGVTLADWLIDAARQKAKNMLK